jgi:hypothetical protein
MPLSSMPALEGSKAYVRIPHCTILAYAFRFMEIREKKAAPHRHGLSKLGNDN